MFIIDECTISSIVGIGKKYELRWRKVDMSESVYRVPCTFHAVHGVVTMATVDCCLPSTSKKVSIDTHGYLEAQCRA